MKNKKKEINIALYPRGGIIVETNISPHTAASLSQLIGEDLLLFDSGLYSSNNDL